MSEPSGNRDSIALQERSLLAKANISADAYRSKRELRDSGGRNGERKNGLDEPIASDKIRARADNRNPGTGSEVANLTCGGHTESRPQGGHLPGCDSHIWLEYWT